MDHTGLAEALKMPWYAVIAVAGLGALIFSFAVAIFLGNILHGLDERGPRP